MLQYFPDPRLLHPSRTQDVGASARFVQNRTLTGVGRATQIKLHHGAYALATPPPRRPLRSNPEPPR
jgi:hypothetical protein